MNENKFAYVESKKISMIADHEKNALGAGYIVEFIHDATENYYERGNYDSGCSCYVSIFTFYVSIIEIIMPSLKGIKEKRLLGDNPTILPTVFMC